MVGDGGTLLVERSLSGRAWRLAAADDRLALTISQRFGLPDVVARAIASRGVDLDGAADFLTPKIRTALPDPSVLVDMDRAVKRVSTAIEAGERIAVFADYDVDGATSAALLVRYFRALGVEIDVHVPDRIDEGYGPNTAAYTGLADRGVSLVLCVDSGTTAFTVFSEVAERHPGLDVVVLDHHTAEARLPPVAALVNPNRLDQPAGLGHLAACGVTFLFLVGLNRALRAAGRFAGRQEPPLIDLTGLVALGTVCDVVPLTGVNRALVAAGLARLRQAPPTGLRALAEVARIDKPLAPFHLGYVLGPRLNAGGRIGDAGLGARLLSTDDPEEARETAELLDATNTERRQLEADTVAAAVASVDAAPAPEPVLLVAGEGWHPGVIGLVAARLKERYNRPACAIALDGTGRGKASGRSLPGFDLGRAIVRARLEGLLVSGGGHPMAAGFTVEVGRIEALRRFLAQRVDELPGGPPRPVVALDGLLTAEAVTLDLVQALAALEPFGSGNREPRFALPRVRLAHARVVGGSHVAATVAGADGTRLKAIAFRAVGTPLGDALLNPAAPPLALAGEIREDSWQGRVQPQFVISDAADPLQGR